MTSSNISRLLLPSVVVVLVCIIVNKFFPEEVKPFEKDLLKNLRGNSKMNLVRKIVKNVLKDKA